MNNVAYLLALHSIDGLGPIRLKAVLEYFKDPKVAWEISGEQLIKIGIPRNTVDLFLETRKKLDPQKYLADIQNLGIKWVTIFDKDYPKLLAQIYDPPIVLYYKGNLDCLNKKSIAVVGTRKMTEYGKAACEKFVKTLVQFNLTIVSGLAKGVETQVHKSAIEAEGQTIAVLGEDLLAKNEDLAQEIINGNGAIVSEFGNFPAGNRIISGLSLATLVIEAAQDSGSLITAREALEQGRDVFAISGPNNLTRDWVISVYEPEEILDEMGIFQSKNYSPSSDEERQVLDILENETLHIDEIGRILNMTTAKITALLLKMEITGLVQNLGSGTYCKV